VRNSGIIKILYLPVDLIKPVAAYKPSRAFIILSRFKTGEKSMTAQGPIGLVIEILANSTCGPVGIPWEFDSQVTTGDQSPSSVPAPASTLLLGSDLTGLPGVKRNRKKI